MYDRKECWRYQKVFHLKQSASRSGKNGIWEEDKHARGVRKVRDARCKTVVGEPGRCERIWGGVQEARGENLCTPARCEYGRAIEHELGDLELDRVRMLMIIVGRFWQVRVLGMRIMAVSIVVACISVVLIVVVEAAVVVDSVVVRTEISLERHVVVVVVAGVRSDGGRQMNTGSDERALDSRWSSGPKPKVSMYLSPRWTPARFETWASSTNLFRASKVYEPSLFLFFLIEPGNCKHMSYGQFLPYCPSRNIHVDDPDPRECEWHGP